MATWALGTSVVPFTSLTLPSILWNVYWPLTGCSCLPVISPVGNFSAGHVGYVFPPSASRVSVRKVQRLPAPSTNCVAMRSFLFQSHRCAQGLWNQQPSLKEWRAVLEATLSSQVPGSIVGSKGLAIALAVARYVTYICSGGCATSGGSVTFGWSAQSVGRLQLPSCSYPWVERKHVTKAFQ